MSDKKKGPGVDALVIGAAAVAVSDFGIVQRYVPSLASLAGLPIGAFADAAIGATVGSMAVGRKSALLSGLAHGIAATFAAGVVGPMIPLPQVGPFNLGRLAAGAAASYGVEMLFGADALPDVVAKAV